MKPKTTLNLLKYFFSNIIQKKILFLSSFFNKKEWSIPFEISHIPLLVLKSSISFAESVLFITISKIEKNRKRKSAHPEKRYYYTMYIPNY